MEDLLLGRIAAFVPEFAVKDLPWGRALIMMTILNNISLYGRIKDFVFSYVKVILVC